jgi:hypothetical protein
MPLSRRYSVETLWLFGQVGQVQRDRLGRRGQWLEVVLAAPAAKIVPVVAVGLQRVGRLGVSGVVLGLLGDAFQTCERARVHVGIEVRAVILVVLASIATAGAQLLVMIEDGQGHIGREGHKRTQPDYAPERKTGRPEHVTAG